jgi:hypothetical protein
MVAEGQLCDSGAVRIHDMNVALSTPVAIERDLRPSGDQSGLVSIPGAVASWVTSLPSAFITKISVSKLPPPMKAILVPSGDQAGVFPPVVVSWVIALPSGFIR